LNKGKSGAECGRLDHQSVLVDQSESGQSLVEGGATVGDQVVPRFALETPDLFLQVAAGDSRLRSRSAAQRPAQQVGLAAPRLGGRRGGPAGLARLELYLDLSGRSANHNSAKAAVARKILIAAWHMLSRNQPFNPAPPTTRGTPVPASSRLALAA
jgi:hypothetical protein